MSTTQTAPPDLSAVKARQRKMCASGDYAVRAERWMAFMPWPEALDNPALEPLLNGHR